jgi:predicted metalloenzyme YecM
VRKTNITNWEALRNSEVLRQLRMSKKTLFPHGSCQKLGNPAKALLKDVAIFSKRGF